MQFSITPRYRTLFCEGAEQRAKHKMQKIGRQTARPRQLHCPIMWPLAVLPPPIVRFELFWHSKLPRTLLPTTSTWPVLSSTDILPPTELSNISAELVLPTTSILPPIVLPAQVSGGAEPIWTASSIVIELHVAVNRRAAHEIARTARWDLLDHEVAAYRRGWAKRVGPTAVYRHVAANRCVIEDEGAADHRDIAGDPAAVKEYTLLTGGDGHIAVEGALVYPVAEVPSCGCRLRYGLGNEDV